METTKEMFRITPDIIFPAIIFLGTSIIIISLCLAAKICNTPPPYNFCAYGLGGLGVIALIAIFFWPTKDNDEEYFDIADENEGS